jgi:hypothetical protein
MKRGAVVNILKTASACLREFESERKIIEEKLAKSNEEVATKAKEAEALKIAMELVLDESTLKEVQEKAAALNKEDLTLVKKAMELDLSKKIASLGEVAETPESKGYTDPVHGFISILRGK